MSGHQVASLGVGPLRIGAHRAIYGTIVVMTTLALVEDSDTDLAHLVAAVLAPLVALSVAHAFSDIADRAIAVQRPLTAADTRAVLRENAEYLLVAVPPLLLLVAGALVAGDPGDAVTVTLVAGAASLAFWGAFAAARAGLSRRWRTWYALAYGVLGLAVVTLELAMGGH